MNHHASQPNEVKIYANGRINIAEALGPTYDSVTLKGLAMEIRNDLYPAFCLPSTKFEVLYLGSKKDAERYIKLIFRNFETTKKEIKQDIQDLEQYSCGWCNYLDEESGECIDYVVALPRGIYSDLPYVLGHEILHGDHGIFHIGGGDCDYEDYFTLFPQDVREFLAFLGYGYIERKLRKHYEERFPRPKKRPETFGETVFFDNYVPHKTGNDIAEQFLDKRGNCIDAFHAGNKHEVWETVRDTLIPEISIPVPKKFYTSGKGRLKDYFKSLKRDGLRAEVEFKIEHPPEPRRFTIIYIPEEKPKIATERMIL